MVTFWSRHGIGRFEQHSAVQERSINESSSRFVTGDSHSWISRPRPQRNYKKNGQGTSLSEVAETWNDEEDERIPGPLL